MPIKYMTTSPAPGHLVQVCAGCGAEHRISLDRGAQKTRTGPVALQVGDTLEVRVDAQPPQVVTFAAGDFTDFARVTVAELVAKFQRAVAGVNASDDAGGLLLESAATGPQSRIEITGGTARVALGFSTHGAPNPCPGRPVLGISMGSGAMQDPSVLALRRCNDCGANECLVRSFERAAPELAGTHFQEHRRAVNTLAEHCKARGWSHPDVADKHTAETKRPVDMHAAFPDRWELSQAMQPTGAPATTVRAEISR